jgi:hypothetical protein
MQPKPETSPNPQEEQIGRAISALRAQRRRHLEALAEIDEALRQLGVGDEEEHSAEDPQFRAALDRVNQLYGQALRRLA